MYLSCIMHYLTLSDISDESKNYIYIFFFKQKTAYEMRISDWSSDVCSSDLCLDSLLRRPACSLKMRLRSKERESILDLACGAGNTARQVAPLVGMDGRLVAVAINPAMPSSPVRSRHLRPPRSRGAKAALVNGES